MKKLTLVALAVLALSAHAQSEINGQADFARTYVTHDRVRTEWLLMYNQNGKWPNGIYQWWFNPANIPANLTKDQVLGAMQTASSRWAQMCNITFQYMGTTSIPPGAKNSISLNDLVNVWGFTAFDPSINGFNGFTPTEVVGGTVIDDADIMLNTSKAWDYLTLEAILTHEIGHSIGIAHSNVVASVMYANPYHDANYVRTLRGDDVAACTALYGASPNQLTNRTLNWAESNFPSALNAGPSPTAGWNGYVYRYYSGSNSYAGSKDGNAYFMGPDGVIQSLGPLGGFTAQVGAAGF